jgi:hypothetical protein
METRLEIMAEVVEARPDQGVPESWAVTDRAPPIKEVAEAEAEEVQALQRVQTEAQVEEQEEMVLTELVAA